MTDIELELLIDAEMWLMVKKSIRGGILHEAHMYVKANNRYIKDYDPSTELSYSCTAMSAIYMDGCYHTSYL